MCQVDVGSEWKEGGRYDGIERLVRWCEIVFVRVRGVFQIIARRVKVMRLERKWTSLGLCGARAGEVGDAPQVGVM